MKIHHLNCGTHCPFGGALFDASSKGPLARIDTHCLLIETDRHGLVLVDTGYGLNDIQAPHARLPWLWPMILNIRLHEEDTALRQIERLGFAAADVRHIVLTHLDFDHAGGISDFPHARVHVMAEELEAARHRPKGFVAGQRYRPEQWASHSDWKTYHAIGDSWHGFEAVRALDGLPPEILMIPLRGHTAGHAGIAIEAPDGWLLHAGDAYLHRHQMDPLKPRCPLGLSAYEFVMDTDRPARRRNQRRLLSLACSAGAPVRIFCSHDSQELADLQTGIHL